MAIKFNNIFHSKALQNFYPSWYFWFENKPSGNPGELLKAIRQLNGSEIPFDYRSLFRQKIGRIQGCQIFLGT
jgi:hypothetical protein